MKKHRITNNEMYPGSECGQDMETLAEQGDSFALMDEEPTCPSCWDLEADEESEEVGDDQG